MPDELRLAGAFALSMTAVVLLVPLVIRLALRTGFMDLPKGYKGHSRATPYLGGAAVVVAVGITVFVFGVATSRYAALLIWALALFAVGTIDDRRNLNPLTRLLIEVLAAAALWNYGLGWAIFGSAVPDLALTILWVVGLVNAFNLMDNMDGAAATVAGISATGTAILAVIVGDIALAVIVLSVAAACLGFLPYNLSKPARVFLGDGGSMPLGFIVAGAVMAMPGNTNLGAAAVLAAIPMVGLPILDTTLVVISRRRAHRPVLSGGRDHLTHRLRSLFAGSTWGVAATLGTAQTLLCVGAVALAQAAPVAVIVVAAGYLGSAIAAIYALETRWQPAPWVPDREGVHAHLAHVAAEHSPA